MHRNSSGQAGKLLRKARYKQSARAGRTNAFTIISFFKEKGEAGRQWIGVTHQQGARAAERTYASSFSFSPFVLLSCSICPSAYTICRQEIHLYLLGGPFLQGPIFSHIHTPVVPGAVREWYMLDGSLASAVMGVPTGVWKQCAVKGHADLVTHTEAAQGIPNGGTQANKVWELSGILYIAKIFAKYL